MLRLIVVSSLTFLAACGGASGPTDAEKADIDCLAAKTVVSITDTIRIKTGEGVEASELSDVPKDKIADAQEIMQAEYSGKSHAAYLEAQVNQNLKDIQADLTNRTADNGEKSTMEQVSELATTCSFGA